MSAAEGTVIPESRSTPIAGRDGFKRQRPQLALLLNLSLHAALTTELINLVFWSRSGEEGGGARGRGEVEVEEGAGRGAEGVVVGCGRGVFKIIIKRKSGEEECFP